jgi:hypothetical protein
MSIERRRAPRYRLAAAADVADPVSHARISGRTSDVSLLGCFINTNYSLPQGTKIQVRLTYEGTTFSADGSVARSEPSMGFGISFVNLVGAQQDLLQKWLTQPKAGSPA